MKTLFGLLTLVLVSSVALAAPVCVTQSLSDYMALPDGCTVGANTFSNFAFSSSAFTFTPLTSGQITVTPSVGTFDGHTAIVFTFSGPFTVPDGNGYTQYFINYSVQAAQAWLVGGNLEIGPGVEGFSAPNTVTLNQINGVSPLGTNGLGGIDEVAFDPSVSSLAVENTFFVQGLAGGGAKSVSSFANSFEVPEPLSLILVGSGLLGLGLLRRRYQ